VQQCECSTHSGTGAAHNRDILVFEKIGIASHTITDTPAQKFLLPGNAQFVASHTRGNNKRLTKKLCSTFGNNFKMLAVRQYVQNIFFKQISAKMDGLLSATFSIPSPLILKMQQKFSRCALNRLLPVSLPIISRKLFYGLHQTPPAIRPDRYLK
jgi:hypothetical protein